MSAAQSQTVAAIHENQYLRHVERVADRLRECANRFEAQGRCVRTRNGRPRHVSAAADALQELNVMFGNWPTWQMLVEAGDAEREAFNEDVQL